MDLILHGITTQKVGDKHLPFIFIKEVFYIATLANLNVLINANTSGFQSAIGSVKNSLMGLAAAAGFAGLTAGFASLTKSTIAYSAEIESIKVQFDTIFGKSGTGIYNQLKQIADLTPFEMPGLAMAAAKLGAFGFAAKNIPGMIVAIGNAASALNLGQPGIDRVTLALGQMAVKGKVSGEEIRQLNEVGIDAAGYLAAAAAAGKLGKNTKLTKAEIMDTGKKLLPVNESLQAILDGMNNDPKFFNALAKQSKTLNGLWSTLKDNFNNLKAAIFETYMEPLKKVVTQVISVIRIMQAAFQKGGFNEMKKVFLDLIPKELKADVTQLFEIISNAWEIIKKSLGKDDAITWTQVLVKTFIKLSVYIGIAWDVLVKFKNLLKSAFSDDKGNWDTNKIANWISTILAIKYVFGSIANILNTINLIITGIVISWGLVKVAFSKFMFSMAARWLIFRTFLVGLWPMFQMAFLRASLAIVRGVFSIGAIFAFIFKTILVGIAFIIGYFIGTFLAALAASAGAFIAWILVGEKSWKGFCDTVGAAWTKVWKENFAIASWFLNKLFGKSAELNSTLPGGGSSSKPDTISGAAPIAPYQGPKSNFQPQPFKSFGENTDKTPYGQAPYKTKEDKKTDDTIKSFMDKYGLKEIEMPNFDEIKIDEFEDGLGDSGKTAKDMADQIKNNFKQIVDAIKSASQEIGNFGNIFDKVTFEKFSPSKMVNRSKKYLEVVTKWTSNIDDLVKKGVAPEIINDLRSKGLEGAGLAMGMNKASAGQLAQIQSNYAGINQLSEANAVSKVKFEHSGTIYVQGANGELFKITANKLAQDMYDRQDAFVITPSKIAPIK